MPLMQKGKKRGKGERKEEKTKEQYVSGERKEIAECVNLIGKGRREKIKNDIKK